MKGRQLFLADFNFDQLSRTKPKVCRNHKYHGLIQRTPTPYLFVNYVGSIPLDTRLRKGRIYFVQSMGKTNHNLNEFIYFL